MSDNLKTLQSIAKSMDNPVIKWACDEIARLREERDALLESQLWGVNCKPSPPEAAG